MKTVLFWHRRDLRITDNAGLYKALKSEAAVQPIFIFDETILKQLPRNDQRVVFIHREIARLKKEYRELGADLKVYVGNPIELIPIIAQEHKAVAVYANRDYEPYAKQRDSLLFTSLSKQNCELIGAKDHVIFEKTEVTKADGLPYTVFTPYMRKWKEQLNSFQLKPYPTVKYVHFLAQSESATPLLSLEELGFDGTQLVDFPESTPNSVILTNYHETRDIPAVLGTSRMSLALRFGTISIRELATIASTTNEKYFNELIWRDFYQMIIHFFPQTETQAFKPNYDRIQWEFDENQFQAWCDGKTGYPLVDAGMRELNKTGHMHNRVRMVVASFLTKHLLHDWRLGERYFAEKLLDFELASNIGGWQWAASSGCDAAPYFRVFNPTLQQERFDPKMDYIKRWIPEFGTNEYPEPIVDHVFARERVLKRYKDGLAKE